MLKYDPTITPQGVATFVAVLSAWLIPIILDYRRVRKCKEHIRNNISLYLDIMEMKICIAINQYFQPGKRVPTGRNSFESQNKANHDILESMAQSEYLRLRDREELLKFIRFYKIVPTMKDEDDFIKYKDWIQCPTLRKIFPRSTTLDKEINIAIDNLRAMNRRQIEKKRK